VAHTLLLADDSVTIQRVIGLTFAGEQVSVVTCNDGEDAIRAMTAAAPDIVLASVDMPSRTGYEIAAHVKESPTLSHVPVVLLAGAFETVDEDKVRAAGARGVLRKPLDRDGVIRRVKDLLTPGDTTSDAAASFVVEAPRTPATAALDNYFDSLDQAIAARVAAAAHPSPAPAAESPDVSRPLLASAFSAILDAEETGGDEAELAAWIVPPLPASTLAVTDELVAEVTRRVLDRLSDRVMRDAVTELVSTTAERLVIQEIERIKSNIK
jgi:CheY-like chemotaxis protein